MRPVSSWSSRTSDLAQQIDAGLYGRSILARKKPGRLGKAIVKIEEDQHRMRLVSPYG